MSSLAKVTVTGEVTSNPEKRFTEGNLAITSFTMNFGLEGQEKVIRVFALGRVAEKASDTVQKGQSIIVDGRLQTTTLNDNGTEKKVTEINAQGIEIIQKPDQSYASSVGGSAEVSNEDLIGEEEIPF